MSPLNVTLNELEDEQENSVEGSSNFKKQVSVKWYLDASPWSRVTTKVRLMIKGLPLAFLAGKYPVHVPEISGFFWEAAPLPGADLVAVTDLLPVSLAISWWLSKTSSNDIANKQKTAVLTPIISPRCVLIYLKTDECDRALPKFETRWPAGLAFESCRFAWTNSVCYCQIAAVCMRFFAQEWMYSKRW